MAEPQASVGSAFGLGLVSALLGPVLGHWALVFVGAGLGAFLAVSAANTSTVRAALPVFARALIVAVLLTGVTVTLAAPYLGTTADVLIIPVAGLLAWRHDRLGALLDRALELLRSKRGAE